MKFNITEISALQIAVLVEPLQKLNLSDIIKFGTKSEGGKNV